MKVVPGCGSRSMRSSSGWSLSPLRVGHGWKVIVPICAHQATVARLATQTSSAVRPLGKVTRVVSTYDGAPLGTRLL